MKSLALVCSAFLSALCSVGACYADEITDVRFGEHQDYTRIVIETDAPVEFQAFTLSDPAARLVIAFDQASWGVRNLPTAAGYGVGAIDQFQFDDRARAARLVFSLNSPSVVRQTLSLDPNGGGYRTVVDIAPTTNAAFQRTSGFPAPSRTLTDLLMEEVGVEYVPTSCEVITVVIDPGHGGSDPGALARFGGGDEADVNLAAGLILRDLLQATGRYNVVMTRDRDVTVELDERVEIAREADADLFISLHADSAGGSSRPNGPGVFLMNHRAVARATRNATRQGNWIDASRPQDVTDLLATMVVENKRSQSERFASTLFTEVGRVREPWRSAPAQANFAVLTDAATPAILFEMGFLTNRSDSRKLNSPRDQRRLMQAVLGAIESHFARCGGGEPRSRYLADASGGRTNSSR